MERNSPGENTKNERWGGKERLLKVAKGKIDLAFYVTYLNVDVTQPPVQHSVGLDNRRGLHQGMASGLKLCHIK